MLKKLTLAISAATAVASSGFAAAETVKSGIGDFDVSMKAGLTTNYVFRGISQSRNHAAAQAGLDIAHSSGLYIGTWGSSTDFIDTKGEKVTTEMDYYLGFGHKITDNISYDLGWIKYSYPGTGAANYSEVYGSISAYGFKLGTAYSSDFHGPSGPRGKDAALYTYLGYQYTLPYEIGLALEYGQYDVKDNIFFNSAGVAKENHYNDWSIGLTKTLVGLDFGLTYSDTSLSTAECASFIGDNNSCRANFTLSVTKKL